MGTYTDPSNPAWIEQVKQVARDTASDGDRLAVVCSDGDIEHCATHAMAEIVRDDLLARSEFLAGPGHVVEIVELDHGDDASGETDAGDADGQQSDTETDETAKMIRSAD